MQKTKQKNKGSEWAASYVLEDHMAVVCGRVWAVVSFSVLLSGVKGLGGGGGVRGIMCTPEAILAFKSHTNTLPLSTIAYHQYHYSFTHDADLLNPLCRYKTTCLEETNSKTE